MTKNIMDSTVKLLFDYIRSAIYTPDKALLNIDELPEQFREFGMGLKYYVECVMETSAFCHLFLKVFLTDHCHRVVTK